MAGYRISPDGFMNAAEIAESVRRKTGSRKPYAGEVIRCLRGAHMELIPSNRWPVVQYVPDWLAGTHWVDRCTGIARQCLGEHDANRHCLPEAVAQRWIAHMVPIQRARQAGLDRDREHAAA